MPIHESQDDDMGIHEGRGRDAPFLAGEPLAADAAVQAQVALRLIAGLVDHLAAAGILAPDDGARIAEAAAVRAEAGGHSLRRRIAQALRRIIAR